MNLPALSVRRAVTFSMIFLVITLFGFLGLRLLPMDLMPNMEFPIAAVITDYQGASPEDMETLITRPIEGTVSRVSGIKNVTSESRQGISFVILEFEWGTDMDQAKNDIRESLDLIRDMLPTEVRSPLVFAFNPSQIPVAFLGLRGDVSGSELREIGQNQVEPLLERIPGVAAVNTNGGQGRQIQVLLDPLRLKARGISPQQVVRAIGAENVQIPTGSYDQAGLNLSVKGEGKYTSVEQIAATVVGYAAAAPIEVRDVAEVVDGFEEKTYGTRVNGDPSVLLVVMKQSDANSVKVAEKLLAALPSIQSTLPTGISLDVIFEQSDFIKRAMGNLANTAVLAFIMAALVLLFFLQELRASAIIAMSIPLSMLATFFVMYLIGVSLNVISLAGLALAVGMLVDNSIVVLENTVRFIEEGQPPMEAAVNGPSEVLMAITASTLTTVSVFLPVLFVPGIAGVMFRDMALTICASLAVSLIVAVALVPLLGSRLLRPGMQVGTTRVAFMQGFAAAIKRILNRLEDRYEIALRWVLGHRKITMALTTVIFFGSIGLVATLGGEFLPASQDDQLTITLERAPGTSLDEMERSIGQVEQIVMANVPEANSVMTQYGPGEGFASFSAGSTNQGSVQLQLKDIGERDRDNYQIRDAIKPLVAQVPGVTATYTSGGGPSFMNQSPIVVEIYGFDMEEDRRIAMTLADSIRTIPDILTVDASYEEGRPEMEVVIDRDYASSLGLSGSAILATLSTYVRGTVATYYAEGGHEYEVLVRAQNEQRDTAMAIRDLLVPTPTGAQVPMSDLVQLRPSLSPTQVQRKNQERLIYLNIDLEGNDLRGATAKVEQVLRDFDWPSGHRWAIGGASKDMMESFGWLIVALFGGALLVYMVMASQFESLLDPFIIIFTIPLAFIGVALALFITRTTLSVMAMIGTIILVGIVVNNAIVLVDYVEQLRGRGMGMREAVVAAGRRRLRPILMTALTTILAMVPLAMGIGAGAKLWAPLGRAVVGGMTTATFLTLLIIPVVYTIFGDLRERLAARRVRKARARESAGPSIVS